MEIGTPKSKKLLHPAIIEILEGFQDIFKEHTDLPPSRSHDHPIALQEGAKHTCVRPYMYP
jgi:hypothetical protein